VAIVRYPDSNPAAVTTGSPIHLVTGGYHIYIWKSSGSIRL
jgi:hypothetical protein